MLNWYISLYVLIGMAAMVGIHQLWLWNMSNDVKKRLVAPINENIRRFRLFPFKCYLIREDEIQEYLEYRRKT